MNKELLERLKQVEARVGARVAARAQEVQPRTGRMNMLELFEELGKRVNGKGGEDKHMPAVNDEADE